VVRVGTECKAILVNAVNVHPVLESDCSTVRLKNRNPFSRDRGSPNSGGHVEDMGIGNSAESIRLRQTSTLLLPMLHATLSAHKGPVHVARYARGSAQHILTGGQDRTVRLWNPQLGTEIKVFNAHGYEVLSLAVLACLLSLSVEEVE
jgi:WD40 repeat protein